MTSHLPPGSFLVEYAKSGRSACKGCQGLIKEGTVRMAIMQRSPFFDGVTPLWHHLSCMFNKKLKNRSISADEIYGLDTLRWEDQERIRNKLEKAAVESGVLESDFGLQIEYAKSSRSMCRGCEDYIPKNDIRMGFLVDSSSPFGPTTAWHHVACFFRDHKEKATRIEQFAGWKNLRVDDIKMIREMLGQTEITAKEQGNGQEKAIKGKKKLVKQEQIEPVSGRLTRKKARELSIDVKELNETSSTGESECDSDSENQKVDNFSLSNLALKKQTEHLWETKDKLKVRLKDLSAKEQKDVLLSIFERNCIPADNFPVSMLIDMVADLLTFGCAELCPECNLSRLVWDSNQHRYQCMNYHAWGKCTGEKDVGEVTLEKLQAPDLGQFEIDLNDLFGHIQSRIVTAKGATKRKLVSVDELKGRKASVKEDKKQSVRLQVKGFSTVEEESGLVDTHHVLHCGGVTYSSVLVSSDIASGRNSYYKLQCLEGDWIINSKEEQQKRRKRAGHGSAAYYFFRSWGRVGTGTGDSRLERCENIQDAIERFCHHFLEKTGNEFGTDTFVKKPKAFYPLDISLPSADHPSENNIIPGSKTQLEKPIQELIQMIFDVEAMKRTMLEFDIDLSRMPLGKISGAQINHAFAILSDLSDCILSEKPARSKIVELSNQFYTLVPHDVGFKQLPLLGTTESIKQKIDMLEMLRELEVATHLLAEEKFQKNLERDPIDIHYESLNAKISHLSSNDLIKDYVATTHGPTHQEYRIEVENVFEIERFEDSRYEALLEEHPELATNTKLLWHGSRTTNFAGIIRQGLRIAPPEAPATGYMFGKGIYFSDMVTKSANYCNASPDYPYGILILSEVALGKMYEKLESEYLEELPPGFSSTKGVGKLMPKNSKLLNSLPRSFAQEIECPLGPPVENIKAKKSELQYNEYIVYNEAQVNMRYLLLVRMEYRNQRSRRRK